MRIVICEGDCRDRQAVCDAINGWMKSTNREDVSYACFRSSEDLLESWEKGLAVDLLFLGVQFPGEMDGMRLAQKIRAKDPNVSLVFAANHASDAFEGYVVNALRCLKRPIQKEQIGDCLDIAYQRFALLAGESIVVKARAQRLVVRYSDLIYLEARSHYLQLHTSAPAETPEVRARLRDFAQRLPKQRFVQCHRGCIVNLEHIRGFGKTALTMSNRHIVPISQTYFPALEHAFNAFFAGVGGANPDPFRPQAIRKA